MTAIYDLCVVGGGVNGCGIARDAAGRDLKVILCEQDDLAQATSSASTKLFHGGLRYLEHYKFSLVGKALRERDHLLRAMPHISWPLGFVLPYHSDLRPAWLLRLGLHIYDLLGGKTMLPRSRKIRLEQSPFGQPLKDSFRIGFEYSDCWVQDARLVVLNARDAAHRGATIATRTRVIGARAENGIWQIQLLNRLDQTKQNVRARFLVNAAGPWVDQLIRSALAIPSEHRVRLVRGSHIITRSLFDHDHAYIFQNSDNRIIFAIPYENQFTLIGTTDVDHTDRLDKVECSDEESAYLCETASQYFKREITQSDIVWKYAGVRPLYDDGASAAKEATRDYILSLEDKDQAPLLNVFGGKITTYRVLAEEALNKISRYFPQATAAWTRGVSLPGGDFAVDQVETLVASYLQRYPFLDRDWALRLVRNYGTEVPELLADAHSKEQLGIDFGATLSEREVRWLIDKEWAMTVEDILWRRTKLGLLLSDEQVQGLQTQLEKMNSNKERKTA